MSTASAPRSASRPTGCTPAGRWGWKASPRRSSSSSATGRSAVSAAVGVLGGTFDPVHNAHLALARAALAALELGRILWIPTGAPPYRPPPVASGAHRLAMLALALQGEPRYVIDERELAPGVSGYTFDTLAALRRELGSGVPLVLLMGSDQYAKRASWYRWPDLEPLCRIAVFARPAAPLEDPHVACVPMPPSAISASDLRRRIGLGADVSAMLPPAVLAYIRHHHLYGHP